MIWADGAHFCDGVVQIAIALLVLFLLFGGGRRDYVEDRPL